MKTKWILIAIVLVVIGAIWYSKPEPVETVGGQTDAYGCLTGAGYSWCEPRNSCIRQWEKYCTATPGKTAVFSCADSKSIKATFYPGDDRFVDLELSDDRMISIPRAISASGARYAKTDESFVFWNKGDTAFISEGVEAAETFSGCNLTE